jgi:transposase-like protein
MRWLLIQGQVRPMPVAVANVLVFTSFPEEIWRQIWSNNPQEAAEPRNP